MSVFSVRIVCYRKEVREEIVCKKERKAGREIQRGNCGSDVQYAERRSKARLLARRAGLPATRHKYPVRAWGSFCLTPSQRQPAYDQIQVTAHQDAVALFEAYAKAGDDAQLKTWAAKTLPHLKQHLTMAQKLK